MSITIYMPYFYIIQHVNSGKYYAGVKYAKNANPENLLKLDGYQTSSNIVKQIILEEGLEAFLIRKIKVFETGQQALDYESRFLRKVDASFNELFLNRNNNSLGTLNVDHEKFKQTMLGKYGAEHAMQSEELREKYKQTCLKNLGVESPFQSKEVQEKKIQTCLKNYGVEYPIQSEKVKEKYKHTCLEKYGVENSMQSEEIKEKIKQTCLDKYGVENPAQLDEVKDKIKQTCLDKYGVENPFQLPEVKEKIKEKSKQTCLLKYGCDYAFQTVEVKNKIRQVRNNLSNRIIVSEIRKYKNKFKLKLGVSWFLKKEEILDDIFLELKTTYGELI